VVAVVLAREAKGLIIGESADPVLIARLRRIVEARPEITAVNHVRTIHTAPDSVFVAISADFVDGLSMGAAERAIEDMESQLKAASPIVSSIYIRPERREDAVLVDR
jgi:divalent metal cation (Fe/Co/Zn/Cd) transporter